MSTYSDGLPWKHIYGPQKIAFITPLLKTYYFSTGFNYALFLLLLLCIDKIVCKLFTNDSSNHTFKIANDMLSLVAVVQTVSTVFITGTSGNLFAQSSRLRLLLLTHQKKNTGVILQTKRN